MAANLAGMAFIPYYDHLMKILRTNEEMHKTAKGIFKQVAWGAAGTVAGAAIGGPLGAMVGGIAGSVIGYKLSDEYESLIQVLEGLSDDEKKELVKRVQELIGSSAIEALTRFISTQAQRSSLINLLNAAASEIQKGG